MAASLAASERDSVSVMITRLAVGLRDGEGEGTGEGDGDLLGWTGTGEFEVEGAALGLVVGVVEGDGMGSKDAEEEGET